MGGPGSSHDERLHSLQSKSKEELIALLLERPPSQPAARDELLLPSSIFDNDKLSSLETIVKYLKENKELPFVRIADVLGRDQRSIWTTYDHARKKMPAKHHEDGAKFWVPAKIFADRTLSVLETLVRFLKEQQQYSLHAIAEALHRDDRTIWTVYDRAKKKLGGAA